jgi:hypothetical protein
MMRSHCNVKVVSYRYLRLDYFSTYLRDSGSCNIVIATSGSVSCPSTTIGEGVAGDVGAVGTGEDTEPAPSTSSWRPPGESAAVAEVGDTGSDEASSPASLLPGLSGGPPSSQPSPPSPVNTTPTAVSTSKLSPAKHTDFIQDHPFMVEASIVERTAMSTGVAAAIPSALRPSAT